MHINPKPEKLSMTSSQKISKKVKRYDEAIIVFTLAAAAAILIKIPDLLELHLHQNEGFYIRNLSLFVLPLLTVYFAWKHPANNRTLFWIVFAFLTAAFFANIYPFDQGADTEILLALHLPVALWLVVGVTYSGGRWGEIESRMEFIRFSGELFIYYVLIALGGMVMMGFMAFIFQTIQIDIEPVFERWILPCGAVGAVIITSWLVEIKQGITENLAPMLAKLFSPLFAIVLVTFLGTLLYTGRALDIERDILIAFDLSLVIVLGLLLYSISARNPDSSPGIFDMVQVVLLISALVVDIIALWAIAGRITEFGFTPNRLVALGLNVILLINLAWSAALYVRFMRGQVSFSQVEKWQTDYLPVYAVWAAVVVIVIPPLFGYS